MTVRYAFPKRVRLYGDKVAAATHIARAETLLGCLISRLTEAGIGAGVQTLQEPGVWYSLQYDGTCATLSITVVPTTNVVSIVPFGLWIPRGFVVYPASSDSTTGWGAPNVYTGSRFDNLAPGLDITKWTTGGGLGEVLLTQAHNGYPVVTKEILPLMFGTTEAKGKTYKAPLATSWTAYRMEFDGYVADSTRQTLFTTLNVGHQYNLPIRGYYNSAERDVKYVVSADFSGSPWITDHDLSAAPVGYVRAIDRKDKDGIVDAASIDTITNAGGVDISANLETEAQLLTGHFTQNRTSLLLGSKDGVTALTAVERQQWIAYGVRYWVPTDPAQPILSWDGYPSWNWPSGLILGLVDGSVFFGLDHFTHKVRGVDTKIFSKRLCANGREIGQLPAFVLSAGLQQYTVPATFTVPAYVVDRIVVLTWQLDDQDGITGDYNRVLRVWFLDVPRRNGVPLALAGPAIDAYDAVTNPSGWHYAGQLQMWDGGGSIYQGFLQPPAFSPDGTRVVAVVAAYDESFVFINTYVPETVFGTIDDSILVQTTTIIDTGGLAWVMPRMGRTDPNAKFPLAVDYKADSLALNAIYYADGITIPITLESTQAIRWSADATQTGPDQVPHDLIQHTDDDGFATVMLFVNDPLTGAMVLVDWKNVGAPSSSFRFRSVRNGGAPTEQVIADAASFADVEFVDVLVFVNDSNVVLPSFARNQVGDYIVGYELCPGGVTEGSHFDTNIGDLVALTQTPGDKLTLYPIGAV